MNLRKPYQPQPITDMELAFPAHVARLMPAFVDIPEDFRRDRGDARPWIRFQQAWFFGGLSDIPEARDGINWRTAIRHLKAIQGSYEPKHEHKEAAVAYLASLWFVAPPTPAPPVPDTG